MTYETKLSFRAKKLPKGFKSQVIKMLPNLKSIERKNEGLSYTTIEKLIIETTLEDLELIKKIYALSKEKNIIMDYMIEDDEEMIFQGNAPGRVFPYIRLKGNNITKYYNDEYELLTEFIDKYETKFDKNTAELAETLENIYNTRAAEIKEAVFIEDIIENWNRQENVKKEGLDFELWYCEEVQIEEL